MFKEGGRMVRRSGERLWGLLEFLGQTGTLLLSMIIHLRSPGTVKTKEGEAATATLTLIPSGSPLDNVGPVPDELRKDPFPGGSVPWSILEAEKERNRTRKIVLWTAVVAVSWAVTAIALLRSFGLI